MESIKELAKEVIKKRGDSEAQEKVREEKKVKKTLEPLKEYTTEPLHVDCIYCDEGRKPRGIGGHIREKHGVPGVSVQEIFDLQKEENEKSLEDFTREKLGNKGLKKLKNVSQDILEQEFPGWKKPGPEEEIPEEEIPEEEKPEEDLEEEGLEEGIREDEIPEDNEKNPGNPELKDNPMERRKFNLMPFFSPLNRRSYRK